MIACQPRAAAFLRLATIASIAVPSTMHGQASGAAPRTIELNNLRTPTSAAFELLDVAPTAIARPTMPRALAIELLSRTKGGSVIPNNYALEVAPYWLVPRPALTYEQYTRPTTAQSIVQSLSISFATARPAPAPDSASDSAATQVALGIRTIPIAGRPSARFLALERQLDSMQRARIATVRAQADALDAAAQRAADSIATLLARQADSMRAIARAMGSTGAERVGTFVEVAAAAAAAYPSSTFDDGRFSRLGVWGTVSYRLESPRLDVVGLLRFLRDLRGPDQNALDLGGRLLWLNGDFTVSAELVSRTAFDISGTEQVGNSLQRALTSSTRAVGILDYRAAEGIYVTMSFGRDYASLVTNRHPLVAIFGIQFLYGDKPLVKSP
jgi:hypothetical protein